MKRGKAAGLGGKTTELVKKLNKHGVEVITSLFNKAWHEVNIPSDWQVGILPQNPKYISG